METAKKSLGRSKKIALVSFGVVFLTVAIFVFTSLNVRSDEEAAKEFIERTIRAGTYGPPENFRIVHAKISLDRTVYQAFVEAQDSKVVLPIQIPRPMTSLEIWLRWLKNR